MTKKHFIALADAIIAYDPANFVPLQLKMLADFCAAQNSRFNRDRWLAYIAGTCGPNGGTIKPPRKPRYITPERKLARRLEGK